MTTVVTLAERRCRKLQAMRTALVALDKALADYGRRHGGRFIRYGSTTMGHMRPDSDVDVLADFTDAAMAAEACRHADDLCLDLGLQPDVRPAAWTSGAFLARALAEGVVLP